LEYNRPNITGKTSVYGVIGDPVDHSMSPLIQNAAFHSIGIDAVYVAFLVKKSNLGRAIQGFRALGVKGLNITAPHKVKVVRYLDTVDDGAAEIGSVNTVINKNGELRGHNTDGLGALKALEEAGARLEGQSVLLFGAGGASRAIAHTLAPHVKSIVLANRTVAKANHLRTRLRTKFKLPITTAALSKELRNFVEEADIIVNASSMGMDGKADPQIEENWLRKDQCVFDIVYKPFETKLLRAAKRAGARTVTGLDLLVNQAACSFELWTGRDAPIHEMRRAIAQHLPAVMHAASS
jgi:shikimate dehydrogenase